MRAGDILHYYVVKSSSMYQRFLYIAYSSVKMQFTGRKVNLLIKMKFCVKILDNTALTSTI